MVIDKVNLREKLGLIQEHWKPRVVGELNDQHLRLVKFKGDFVWHKHDDEDEMFFILSGTMELLLRDRTIRVEPGEFIIVPRGVEHCPRAEGEVAAMMFEPAGTLNTGDVGGERTLTDLERL